MAMERLHGREIVLGVRSDRSTGSWFKKLTATIFHRLMRTMGVEATPQHADFRLPSKPAMVNLQRFTEYHVYRRGFPHVLHSRISRVYYSRSPRSAGETKYPLGITSFSLIPLRVIGFMGASVFLISTALSLYAIVAKVGGDVVPGWASITAPLYALGGMIMLSIGVVGEYVGKIYIEVKRRPRYLLDCVEPSDD